MFKRLTILSLLTLAPSISANWSEYTLLGTINNVVFSYRVFQPSEVAKGSSVQFRAMNLNSMRARVLIDDIIFNCYDGSQENSSRLTKRMKGGDTILFKPVEAVCAERGGFESLSVSLDARVRR